VRIAAFVTAGAGFALSLWAHRSLPPGTSHWPVPIVTRSTKGPYRYLRHPAYVATIMIVGASAYLAAGWWNVLAVTTVTELLLREWAWREDGEGWKGE